MVAVGGPRVCMCRCERDSLGGFCPHDLFYRCQTWVRSQAPSGHIDLEIVQRVAAQLRIVLDMTRNGIGWLQRAQGRVARRRAGMNWWNSL